MRWEYRVLLQDYNFIYTNTCIRLLSEECLQHLQLWLSYSRDICISFISVLSKALLQWICCASFLFLIWCTGYEFIWQVYSFNKFNNHLRFTILFAGGVINLKLALYSLSDIYWLVYTLQNSIWVNQNAVNGFIALAGTHLGFRCSIIKHSQPWNTFLSEILYCIDQGVHMGSLIHINKIIKIDVFSCRLQQSCVKVLFSTAGN